ncbi:MAG: carboxypeptidase-like regulatory domain-containing protein [Deltaproteobacteria bacterium]|nr:carboxypeptidase-like regulatory domain-containing protein [Deltaproteobacteria bacterium]
MKSRDRYLAIAAGITAVALLVLWRTGGLGGDAKPTAATADGSGSATAEDEDPWRAIPKRRPRGSGAADDPSAIEIGVAKVNGQVRDRASQRPVEGAEVAFWSKRGGELTTVSGADGRYQLDVPFGAWSARATTGDDALSLAQAVRVNAHTAAVDLELERLAHAHGVVTDAGGQPVSGAEVVNQGTDRSMQEALDATIGRAVLTDSAGRYRLPVIAGEVRLVATTPGKLGHRAAPAVAPGADVELDLTLATRASIDGVVVDDKGQPVPDARVTSYTTIADVGVVEVKREVATGADGKFMFVDLGPGELLLTARTTEGAAAPGLRYSLDSGDLHDLKLTLAPAATLAGRVTYPDGRPAGGATVRVRRMYPNESFANTTADRDGNWSVRGPVETQFEVTAKDEYGIARKDGVTTAAPVELVIAIPGGFRGAVHTAKGAPITDFTIAIDRFVVATSPLTQYGPTQRFIAADGKFEWPNLEPGAYDLTFRAPGTAAVHRAAVAVPDSAWADLDITLEAGATVSGVVHGNAAAKGAPIANASVVARCSDTSTATNASGAFTLADLPAGPCAIAVTAPGYAPVEVTAQPGVAVDVALAKSGGG